MAGLSLVVDPTCLLAQDEGTIYFDRNWKECDRQHAQYLREYERASDTSYLIEDHFYHGGQLQMRGYAKNFRSPLHEFGKYSYYYQNGSLSQEVTYVDGKEEGEEIRWYSNGKKKSQVTYRQGKKVGPWIAWGPNGTKAEEGIYVDGKRDGAWTSWYNNGQITEQGQFRQGKKVGHWEAWYRTGEREGAGDDDSATGWVRWKWYDRHGTLCAEETYEGDSVVQATYFNEDGSVHHNHDSAWTAPTFGLHDGDMAARVGSQIHYPEMARKNNIEGKVMVQFAVNEQGDLEEVMVLQSANKLLDDEALRVVTEMGKWTPARKHNRPARVYVSVPIDFQLH